MPRLSKSDAGQVAQALRHLLSRTDACPDHGELARILNRLSQRTNQWRRRRVVRSHRKSGKLRQPAAVPSFADRRTVEQVEEGLALAPKFNRDGLLPCIATDAATGEVLMLGYMNREALQSTIATGEAHYWSRSRQRLWRKGTTSGLVQRVVEMRIDDDQDAVWLRVQVGGVGASCHVGYRSCFYRAIELRGPTSGPARLTFTEASRVFDPKTVYGDSPNPTQL